MSYHFSANQFEDQYDARRLGNWENRKWFPDRPRQRTETTKIIANDNGHLLEGVRRENPWGSYQGTWDLPRRITREFAAKLAAPPEKLLARWQKKSTPKPKKKTEPAEEPQPQEEHLPLLHPRGSLAPLESFQKRNRSSSALDLRPKPRQASKETARLDKEKPIPKAGYLDESIRDIVESEEEKQDRPKVKSSCKEIEALPPAWKEKTPESGRIGGGACSPKREVPGEYMKYLDRHLERFEKEYPDGGEEGKAPDSKMEKKEASGARSPSSPEGPDKAPESKSPGKAPVPSYVIAKRYHEDNLRHQPLPDMIDDPVFKAFASSRHPNPGYEMHLRPKAAAIGWRGHATPGPTQCSKLKVYRPKTAVADQGKCYKSQRPKTSSSKADKIEKHFTPIDLAICWDLIPEDPSDEPKPSPHIDGSNGSVAPAVFSVVRPESREEELKRNANGSPQALAEHVLPDIRSENAANLTSKGSKPSFPIATNKEAIMMGIKPPEGSPAFSKRHSATSLNSMSAKEAEMARKNPKTAWSRGDACKALSEKLLDLQKENSNPNIMSGAAGNGRALSNPGSDFSNLSRRKHYQSSPNLASAGCQTSRRCSGSNCGTEKSSSKSSDKCDGRGSATKDSKPDARKSRGCDPGEKTDPAPNPNPRKSDFKCAFKAGVPNNNGSSNSSTPPSEKLKIPKMRYPYAKRSYSISTLIPPFSLWPDHHGQDYPEHWRLASVYQHSYKPMDYRKKSLLASVYQ